MRYLWRLLVRSANQLPIKLTFSDLSASLKWIICRANYTSASFNTLNTHQFRPLRLFPTPSYGIADVSGSVLTSAFHKMASQAIM